MDSELNKELMASATLGHVKDAQQAIANGAEINCRSELGHYEKVTPLMLAVKFGHEKMVRYLIGAKASLNCRAQAIVSGDPSRENALHWAIRENNERICRLLVSAGADVNSESSWGSALQYAIEAKNVSIVKLLLSAGASVNRPSGRDQYLPMHIAAREGNVMIITELLRRGAKLKAHPISGETPLIKACTWGHAKVIKQLLKSGDNPEHRDKKEKRTPLMWAAWSGDEECVRFLLRKKVDVNKTDSEGRTAWDIANGVRAPAAAYWIEKAGGGPK